MIGSIQNSGIYELIECLGEGSTSTVYRAVKKDKGGLWERTVALKILKSGKNVSEFRKEVESLFKIR